MKERTRILGGRSTGVLVVASLAVLAASDAEATVFGFAEAQATLSVLQIRNITRPGTLSGLNADGSNLFQPSPQDVEGNASGSVDGFAVADENGSDQYLIAIGETSPVGLSYPWIQSDSQIVFSNNLATDTYEIDFELNWEIAVGGSATKPFPTDFFYTTALVVLYRGPYQQTLLSDRVTIGNVIRSTPQPESAGTFASAIEVLPQEFNTLYMRVFAEVQATSETPIPEPLVAVLIPLAFFGSLAYERIATLGD